MARAAEEVVHFRQRQEATSCYGDPSLIVLYVFISTMSYTEDGNVCFFLCASSLYRCHEWLTSQVCCSDVAGDLKQLQSWPGGVLYQM